MRRFTCVIIIDAIKRAAETGREPGEVVRYEAKDFKDMPAEVTVYAIETAGVETFGEELSPPLAAAAERVLVLVRRELDAA